MSLSIQHHVSLRPFNTFGVEASAACFVRISSVAQLQALLLHSEWQRARKLILGGGSNLLLSGDYDGLVVQMALTGRAVVHEDDSAWYVQVAAGENWHETVLWTLAQHMPGLENLVLIPGSVGAAPVQNIGAYGVELKDRFQALQALDTHSGALVTLSAADCRFAYRDSIFKSGAPGRYIILSVTLRLPKAWQPVLDYGDLRATLAAGGACTDWPASARAIADAVCAMRRSKLPDPAIIGNAGSFFKNPIVSALQCTYLLSQFPALVHYAQADGSHKLAAGWLIDQCGWKGRSLGRAGVHEKQALVLVNRGGASGAEILALAQAIQQSVLQGFGVELEAEPVVV